MVGKSVQPVSASTSASAAASASETMTTTTTAGVATASSTARWYSRPYVKLRCAADVAATLHTCIDTV